MSFIILNGIKSTFIEGLLISSLPPITKPIIRTEIEEIDGRDGDIVTKLGYSAYNREFTIGLHGDFMIDEVIRYFNSSGTVIFSNEPDKVYDYQILEQIDFDRLIRFRTAMVTMHVQPFKHSAVDQTYEYNASGTAPKQFKIMNHGNITSKPVLTIYGSGDVVVALNGKTILAMTINHDCIVIDAELMEAYLGSDLLNRDVAGNYDDLALKVGMNTIAWSGNVTKVLISKYSRWI